MVLCVFGSWVIFGNFAFPLYFLPPLFLHLLWRVSLETIIRHIVAFARISGHSRHNFPGDWQKENSWSPLLTILKHTRWYALRTTLKTVYTHKRKHKTNNPFIDRYENRSLTTKLTLHCEALASHAHFGLRTAQAQLLKGVAMQLR